LLTSRLLEIDHSVWKRSYNACPSVLYSTVLQMALYQVSYQR